MALLGKYTQTPTERKERLIDYSDWLQANETLTTVTFAVTPVGNSPVVCDSSILGITNAQVDLFLSGGDDGNQYKIVVTATTNRGEVKQDEIILLVKAL